LVRRELFVQAHSDKLVGALYKIRKHALEKIEKSKADENRTYGLDNQTLEQSWLKWHHFKHAFCGKNKNIEHFHEFKIKVKCSKTQRPNPTGLERRAFVAFILKGVLAFCFGLDQSFALLPEKMLLKEQLLL